MNTREIRLCVISVVTFMKTVMCMKYVSGATLLHLRTMQSMLRANLSHKFFVRNALYCFSKVRTMCTILTSVSSLTITPYTIGMSKAKFIRNTFYLQMRMDKYQPSTRITIKKEIKTPMEAET